jgi:hypothetical protein
MGPAADIALVTGALAAGNEAVFAPLAGNGTFSSDFNWRIIPATVIFAALMEGLSDVNMKVAMGISVTALITVVFNSTGKAGSPVLNLAKAMGYK